MPNPFLYVVLVILIALSAFFSATETAFSSVNPIRLRVMAENGDKRALRALHISERFDDALSSILIGNNIVNIASASLGTVLCTQLFGEKWGPGISTAAMTVLVLCFGEIIPKSIAKENAEGVSLAVSGPLRGIMTLFKPLVFLFGALKNGVMRMIRSDHKGPAITEDELRYMIEEIEDEGIIEEHESELIQSAMDFNDITVNEILTHRVDVVAAEASQSAEEIKDLFVEERFARIPVYEGTIDNIIGIINDKEFFSVYLKDPHFSPKTILKDPLFVPPKKRISALLKDFQRTKTQMAVVTDQYGGTLGIITVEDILEELVGEIWDEDEEIIPEMTQVEPGRYLVSGDMRAEDFFEKAGWPADGLGEDSVTISGWVMEKMEKVPRPGEQFSQNGITVTVCKTEDQRILQVEIVLSPQEEEEEPPEEG